MDLSLTHETYTKINTLYKRDERGNIIIGDFSLPEFKYLYNNKWLAFEKIDGTNMSFYWDGHEMQIHGKSENSSIPSMLMDTMKNILTEEKLAEVFSIKYDENGNEVPFMMRIYGEGYGDKIQKRGGSYIRGGKGTCATSRSSQPCYPDASADCRDQASSQGRRP